MNTVQIPKILLPAAADMTAWAVNACDQFTSDAEYWREVERITAGKLSTYNLIFPEIYLKDRPAERIAAINKAMRDYLSDGVFKTVEGMILVERSTPSGTRKGIVLSIDLEDYSFKKGAKTLIRSTEATILERIPPRVEIRKNAPIELPHVMLLYDDETDSVLKTVERGETLYDFELNMGGGKVKGTHIANPERVREAFYKLLDADRLIKKYGADEKLLFAVGDGNHSLATAKTCWENIKVGLSEKERETHPARYALVEVVNVYDKALKFEPIHRLVKGVDGVKFAKGLHFAGTGKAQAVCNGEVSAIPFPADVPCGIRELDEYISEFIKANGGEADYVHGADEVIKFSRPFGAGVILPAIKKDDFFRLIITGGNLPRKTFSMGEGSEKRYYIEAKSIK